MKIAMLFGFLLAFGGIFTSLFFSPWARVVGTMENEMIQDMALMSDGTIILVGSTSDSGENSTPHAFVIAQKENGTILWQWKTAEPGWFHAAVATADGVIVAGRITENVNLGFPITIKFDTAGRVLWQKKFGHTGEWQSASKAENGKGVFLVGEIRDQRFRRYRLIAKLDNAGNAVFGKIITGPTDPSLHSLLAVKSGYFLADTGILRVSSSRIGNYTVLFKFDAEGNMVSQRALTSYWLGPVKAMANAPDGGILLAGAASLWKEGNKSYLIKLDNADNIAWQKTYFIFKQSENQDIRSIAVLPDGGYAILAFADFKDWLFKINKTGMVAWSHTMKGSVTADPKRIFARKEGLLFAEASNSYSESDGRDWDGVVFATDFSGMIKNLDTRQVSVNSARVSVGALNLDLVPVRSYTTYDYTLSSESTEIVLVPANFVLKKSLVNNTAK